MSRHAALPVRVAARLLLRDPDGRVLLFPYRPPALGGRIVYWFTPGGGVHAGESLADAACRECLEETGYALADPGEPLARRQFAMRLPDGGEVWADEYYFHVRVGRIALQQDGWSVQERASMGQGRWFDAAALAHPPQPVFPEHLPAMLAAADARDALAAPPDVRDGDTLVPKK
ncbi:NUDIX domain-containing protein [Vogesella sp. DC21W]|uniref:NUDIX domain-containing protein n=1 Tax=Vogesella aquatica TaxID=2984206 RepID=A0ABT5J0K5_9NEIS|nr:NUDIX domain-containing protein [Vogesella aquatica]MDC7718362.1 NUDIX domain-containing protein [Vogesella aquatica]